MSADAVLEEAATAGSRPGGDAINAVSGPPLRPEAEQADGQAEGIDAAEEGIQRSDPFKPTASTLSPTDEGLQRRRERDKVRT